MSGESFFAELEGRSAFRADMFYFLRLTGNNISNIFIMTRGSAVFGQEMDKRAKAHRQSLEREDRGRGR